MAPKITKSNREWQEELTPEQYRVTRQHGTERAFPANIGIITERGNIVVFAVMRLSFILKQNLNQARGGPLSMSHLMTTILARKQIEAFL